MTKQRWARILLFPKPMNSIRLEASQPKRFETAILHLHTDHEIQHREKTERVRNTTVNGWQRVCEDGHTRERSHETDRAGMKLDASGGAYTSRARWHKAYDPSISIGRRTPFDSNPHHDTTFRNGRMAACMASMTENEQERPKELEKQA
jgi:hypothetical protein